jgi:hypothetical protein
MLSAMEAPATEGEAARQAAQLDRLIQELGLLRKTVLRQGHAQELFQARVEEAVGRLAAAPTAPETARPLPPPGPGAAQVRVLLELDQAVLQLLRLAEGEQAAADEAQEGSPETPEDTPRSLREGLSLLQVRVRNLQHSMGLEPIPARNLPFDDRWHEACGVTHRPDLPDGQVVEELLPGYRLNGRVVRPRAGSPEGSQRILVYDLGGGTFDVSVVEIGGGINEVRASGGNNHLGGDDFDRLLADHLAGHLREKTGKELPRDLRLAARLEDAAERAKIDLSARPFARVMEEAILGRLHLDLEVERRSFEALIDPLLDGTLAEVDRALADARLTPEQIDLVVLVGGSTHIPRVQELLAGRFSCPIEHAVDPSLCVALGAAVQGAILAGQVFDHILVDVAAHSLGVKTMDNVLASGGLWGPGAEADYFSPIIRRNTQVPVTRSEVYYTMVDDQERWTIEVYQGESARCSENTLIGRFPFPLRPAPAGSPVVVEFRYDLDGIIRVVAHQKETDNRREVTLSTRTREQAPAGAAGAGPVENYILRKARLLAASCPEGALRERLGAAAGAYEQALAAPGADTEVVDQAEEELLDLLSQVEEAPVGR